MKRVIRFKEWGCNEKLTKEPTEHQIANSTDSLEVKDYCLTTDDNGFIVNGLNANYGSKAKNLVVLGDSFVESLYVDEDKRINAVLERSLSDFNVLNGGYSGATSLHLLNIIINKVIPINPHFVILFVPTNDERIQAIKNGYWNTDKRLSSLVPLGKDSELRVNYSLSSFSSSVEKILQLICLTLNTYEIKYCLGTTPHRQRLDPEDEWFKKNHLTLNPITQKYHEETKLPAFVVLFAKKKRLH